MNTPSKAREAWMQAHPYLNPDYMTRFGPLWMLTERQQDILDREDDDMVHRDEIRHGA